MLRAPDVFRWMRGVGLLVIAAVPPGCSAAEATSLRTTAPSPSSQPSVVVPVVVAPRIEPELGSKPVIDVVSEDEPVDILFVGNSYTHYNTMPAMLSALAEDAEVEVEIDTYTVGGAKLVEHAANDAVHDKLAEHEWDYVVLQAHSLEMFRDRDGFDAAMDELASEVTELGAKPVAFETWARREGHNVLQWYDLTPQTMQDALLSAYTEVARRNDARLAPVGEAWRQVNAAHPDAELHLSDGSHPSVAGSYLTACVLFTVLLDERCSEVSFTPEALDPELAEVLRRAAGDTVTRILDG